MFSLPSPLQKLDLSVFGVDQKVYVKRDDLIHTIVSGNKWRKLKQNLVYFFKSSKNQNNKNSKIPLLCGLAYIKNSINKNL